MSTRHSELRLQGTLEPAFLPLNWKIQTSAHGDGRVPPSKAQPASAEILH